ncbi:hypothetical protein [Nostoc sp.]
MPLFSAKKLRLPKLKVAALLAAKLLLVSEAIAPQRAIALLVTRG